MRILFYYPSNKRTISIETLIRELIKHQHEVLLLTLCERGDLHVELERMGVKTFTHVIEKKPLLHPLKQIVYLASFCKAHNIQTVFSHLQQANIIAVFAQYLTNAKIVIFRHHDYARNSQEGRADKIINRLASRVVVPSSGVQQLMLANEKIDPQKLKIIPYIYDFSKYQQPDQLLVERIKQQYGCRLLTIMVSRLVPQKQHYVTFTVINQLVKEGYDIKMLVMDTGSERDTLEAYIKDNQLINNIFLLGYQTNVIDYIAAADVLVHPSVSEASCSAVKEAGLLEKLVIVCKGVGDFDDYIRNGENGFVINKEYTKEQLTEALQMIYWQKKTLKLLGQELKKSVVERFSGSEEIMKTYNQISMN
jgi:glycosyltransferase involved in cell wall biosynthesis